MSHAATRLQSKLRVEHVAFKELQPRVTPYFAVDDLKACIDVIGEMIGEFNNGMVSELSFSQLLAIQVTLESQTKSKEA